MSTKGTIEVLWYERNGRCNNSLHIFYECIDDQYYIEDDNCDVRIWLPEQVACEFAEVLRKIKKEAEDGIPSY